MNLILRAFSSAAVALSLLAGASHSQAATLLHSFAFETDASDGTGSATATLLNGAHIADGVLKLDGVNDYLEFSNQLIPVGGAALSVAFQARAAGTQNTAIVEILSQGRSGGPGFYVGIDHGNVRLTDQFIRTPAPFPIDGLLHDYVLTSAAGDGTRLYIDGTLVFSHVNHIITNAVGSNTRLGTQFDQVPGQPYSEYFAGDVDNLMIFSGALDANEIASVFAAPVPLPAALPLYGAVLVGFGLAMRRARSRRG